MKKSAFNPRLKQRLLVIVLLSMLLASAMELYTFGITSDFFTRWLRFFCVIFLLTGITALAIIPGVNYVVNRIARKFSL